MASSSRSTAATGAAAPSSAQLSPPKAMALVKNAVCRKTLAAARSIRPSATASAMAQNTTRLAPRTMARQPATDRSRSRVACHCSS